METKFARKDMIYTLKCGTVSLRKSGLGWKSASKMATNSYSLTYSQLMADLRFPALYPVLDSLWR